MFLSRPIYNVLVQTQPAFMAGPYLGLTRNWGLGGVILSGCPETLKALAELARGIKA